MPVAARSSSSEAVWGDLVLMFDGDKDEEEIEKFCAMIVLGLPQDAARPLSASGVWALDQRWIRDAHSGGHWYGGVASTLRGDPAENGGTAAHERRDRSTPGPEPAAGEESLGEIREIEREKSDLSSCQRDTSGRTGSEEPKYQREAKVAARVEMDWNWSMEPVTGSRRVSAAGEGLVSAAAREKAALVPLLQATGTRCSAQEGLWWTGDGARNQATGGCLQISLPPPGVSRLESDRGSANRWRTLDMDIVSSLFCVWFQCSIPQRSFLDGVL
ncbi:hypothetical protein PVAR5_3325 [Paecilomyces variotii No. 5]|uniref:Uncharacterized protein n=1 Tax=Byssochlamys spectabilis (strain No. 5 / NBRC 109023) TaxID=1356009 RepID=V5FY71_BYSSN|nr:hypothetical protein PVAR5_3325 [Paecilomyces variotii No. 5]